MISRYPRRQKATLAGWSKWLPVLMLPFSVLFFETWLNTEAIKKDYKMAELNSHVRELRETLDGLKVDVAKLQNMDRIESEAPDIGLISPQPDQIKVLYCSDLPPAPPSDDVHLLAAAQEGDGSDSQPSTEPSARASEGESWKSETGSQSGRVTAMMARLCRAIVDVYASYRGRS